MQIILQFQLPFLWIIKIIKNAFFSNDSVVEKDHPPPKWLMGLVCSLSTFLIGQACSSGAAAWVILLAPLLVQWNKTKSLVGESARRSDLIKFASCAPVKWKISTTADCCWLGKILLLPSAPAKWSKCMHILAGWESAAHALSSDWIGKVLAGSTCREQRRRRVRLLNLITELNLFCGKL